MINLYSQNGDVQYNIREYIVDTEDEIANLPKGAAMGSTALVLSTAELFMLDGQGEWVKI